MVGRQLYFLSLSSNSNTLCESKKEWWKGCCASFLSVTKKRRQDVKEERYPSSIDHNRKIFKK